MKLAEWARANGVHPKTAYRWWREGILPGPARKVGPRTILVDTAAGDSAAAAGLYARVSCHDQAEDLEPHVARISDWAAKALRCAEQDVGPMAPSHLDAEVSE